MKEFDYYIFIDYSEKYLGYLIIEEREIREFIPKISKFNHYREVRHKSAYLKSIKKTISRNKILSHLLKFKIKSTRETPEIYSDILAFLKEHDNCIVFVCVDDKQFSNFRKLVSIVSDKNVRVIRESSLKIGSVEYKISLVLDTLLNIERLKSDLR